MVGQAQSLVSLSGIAVLNQKNKRYATACKMIIPAARIYPYILRDVRAPRYERFKVVGRPGQRRTMKPATYRQTRLFFRQDFRHLQGDQRHINTKNRRNITRRGTLISGPFTLGVKTTWPLKSNRKLSHLDNGWLKGMILRSLFICGLHSLPGERILEILQRKPVCSMKG